MNFSTEKSKYIRFNVFLLGILPNGNGIFLYDGPDNQGFNGGRCKAITAVDEHGEEYEAIEAELIDFPDSAPVKKGFYFTVDTGFYGDIEFFLDENGAEFDDWIEKHLGEFYSGFETATPDEDGIATHPTTGMKYFAPTK